MLLQILIGREHKRDKQTSVHIKQSIFTDNNEAEESKKIKKKERKKQTIGRLFDDSKHNLIFWCIQIQHTEGGIGDDDSRVLLHMDAVHRDDWDSVFLSVLKFFKIEKLTK